MSNKKRYIYENTKVLNIIDGDTIDALVDLGFNTWKKVRIRFYGINAPETKGEEKPKGLISKNFIENLMPVDSYIKFESLGQDKYGRWLGILYKDDLNINQHMIQEGMAVEYYL